ncbi:ABC transporter ATP-binding protein [Actinophytocola sp. NPDC049390]|uniref:ABC transporter ATP-binding protein n=1 Tax=Actinophytocola sp. NPDC049390 TaxID=3363894 RepID=UPI00379F4412
MLELDRVARRSGEQGTCQDVTFTVRHGEVVGLAGTGTTAVLRLAAGLLEPDAGQVRRSGARVGYLPAEGGLYPRMRVLDQLVYVARLHGADVYEALRDAELWAARFGLRDRRGDRVRQLAPRERARLRLAAVLTPNPDLLVLDDPYAGLDQATADLLTSMLRERAAGGAKVLVACADLDVVARLCDRAVVLHNGRVVAEGAVGELLAAARQELLVDVPSAPPDWAAVLPGVTVLAVHNGLFRLALAPGTDDQAVLTAALATGPVHGFTRIPPRLADLFDVVTAG